MFLVHPDLHYTQGGEVRASTQQPAAMAIACAPATIEATPILNPSHNTMVMSTLSLVSWLNLILRIYLQGI